MSSTIHLQWTMVFCNDPRPTSSGYLNFSSISPSFSFKSLEILFICFKKPLESSWSWTYFDSPTGIDAVYSFSSCQISWLLADQVSQLLLNQHSRLKRLCSFVMMTPIPRISFLWCYSYHFYHQGGHPSEIILDTNRFHSRGWCYQQTPRPVLFYKRWPSSPNAGSEISKHHNQAFHLYYSFLLSIFKLFRFKYSHHFTKDPQKCNFSISSLLFPSPSVELWLYQATIARLQ